MNVPITPGIVGVALGILVAGGALALVALLVRRRSLRALDSVPWVGLIGYLLALWTYALVPAPVVASITCLSPNFIRFPNLVGVAPGARGLLADPAFQELVLNTALFAPLGLMLGVMFRRGILVSTLVGLGLSLAVETTQLTGAWGLYPCAFRQFSTEDVMLNTVGVAAGASIAWLAKHRPWRTAYIDPDSGRANTSGRRLLAIAIDLATVAIGAVASIVFYRLVLTTGLDRAFDIVNAASDSIVGVGVSVVIEAIVLVATGMTVGEQVVDLRRRSRIDLGSRSDS